MRIIQAVMGGLCQERHVGGGDEKEGERYRGMGVGDNIARQIRGLKRGRISTVSLTHATKVTPALTTWTASSQYVRQCSCARL